MTANEYQQKAMFFRNSENSKDDALLLGVIGLCGEAGEAIDHIKKVRFHGHSLDRDYMCKELGDIAWYLAETAWALDIPLEEIFVKNLEKLQKRYPQGFSSRRSIDRE